MVHLTVRKLLITQFAVLSVSLRYIYEIIESVNGAKSAVFCGTLFGIEV
jgi:hypothetical protein